MSTQARSAVGVGGSGRRGSERIGGWSVLAAFAAYLIVQVALFGATGFVLAGQGYETPEEFQAAFESPGVVLFSVAIAGSAALAGGGLAAVIGRRGFGALGLRGVSGRWVLFGVGVGLLGWLVNRGVVLLYFWVTGDASNPQEGLAGTSNGTALQFALVVVLGGLFVPFAEELLFRGVLYGWLRRWGVVLATVVSALVFGLFHVAPLIVIGAAVIGALNAVLYEKSGSIWPAVVAHAANNVLLFAIARAVL